MKYNMTLDINSKENAITNNVTLHIFVSMIKLADNRVYLRASSHRHARHDTDRTVLLCLVWPCELSRPTAGAFCVWSVSECRGAQCDRRTHSDVQRICPAVSSHRHTRQDMTVAPASRPPQLLRKPGSDRPHSTTLYATHNVNTLWTTAYD